jgi:GWxTD domain-containing protein
MKTIRTFLIALLFVSGFFYQSTAKKLQAYISYVTFLSPTDGPYIETYFAFAGNSIQFIKNTNNKYTSNLEVTIIFTQNSLVKAYDKYFVKIPEQLDTLNVQNFIDQHRFALPNGAYSMEIEINDKYSGNKSIKGKDSIIINYPDDKILISGIEPVESYKPTVTTSVFSKSGYDIAPMVINFYPTSLNKITYYAEMYNTEKVLGADGKFLVKTYIEAYESKTELLDYGFVKRETVKPVNVLLHEFNIDKLPSGNYNLVVEIRDKENKVITTNKMFFQRSNPNLTNIQTDFESIALKNSFVEKIINRDTLNEYINCLYPISSEIQKDLAQNLIKQKDVSLEKLQKYFLKFWMDRNYSNPEQAWNAYHQEVLKVNASFSTGINKGYLTDRGRVYLQYGSPNSIFQAPYDAGAYPYEIWHYYQLGANQTNKKFVFYTRDMASNNYELINSNAIGEISDYTWMYKVLRNNESGIGKDNPLMEDGIYGGKLIENFNNY